MEKQTLIFTALPNGSEPDGSVNVSVFITPRLWSDTPEVKVLKLEKFGDFLDWSTRVKNGTWEVAFEGGPTLTGTPVGELPRPELWSALFTKDTEVIPYQFDDYRGSVILTPQTAVIADYLEGIYVRAGTDSGLGMGSVLPTVEALAADPDILDIARPLHPLPTWKGPGERPAPIDLGGHPPEPGPEPVEPGYNKGCCLSGCLFLPFKLLAQLFPKLKGKFKYPGKDPFGTKKTQSVYPIEPVEPPPSAAEPPAPSEPVESGANFVIPPGPPSKNRAAFNALADFISSWTVNAKPAEMPKEEEIKDKYDFHQMVSALGDYPVLLRWFGFVVDLNVPLDGALLPANGTVKALPKITLTGDGPLPVSPRTHYKLNPFVAAQRLDNPEINEGFLRCEDKDLFRVTQVDTVGGGTKMQNTATNVYSLKDKKNRPPTMPDTSGLPALRTAGISIIRLNTVSELETQFERSRALEEFVAAQPGAPQPIDPPDAPPPPPPSDELFAEDLVRGYRVDVFDSKSKAWHSLCQRHGLYTFLKAPDLPGGTGTFPIDDEGFVQFSAAQQVDDPASKILKTADSLFVWDGWSLCAPRPGLSIMPEPDPPPHVDGAPVPPPPEVKLEEIKNKAETNFQLETEFSAVPGSLPRLRFDYSYRLRARICDLAGNSRIEPGKDEFLDDVDEQTLDFPCARFEPVSPPAMMMRAAPTEGESLERLVVRTPSIAGEAQETERHIIPPKVSQLMAEQHGKFDGPTEMDKDLYDIAARESGALTDGAVQVNSEGMVEAGDANTWIQPAEQFTLTYLPDPSSRGALLLGLPGMADNQIIEPGDEIVNKVPFAGEWPHAIPFRIRLVGIPAGTKAEKPKWIKGAADGKKSVLEIQLAESEKKVIRLSSYLQPKDLERQGVWQWTKSAAPGTFAQVMKDTTAGRSWLQLPWREITLVHAVLMPLKEPALLPLTPVKNAGETFATISGKVRAHAASTSKVDVIAKWEDPIDDVSLSKFVKRKHELPLCEVPIDEGATETEILDHAKQEPPKHNFGDTKFHLVTYTPVATTRFREYFPQWMTQKGENNEPINVMKEGAPSPAVRILNSARPDAPKVLYVVPFYDWQEDQSAAPKTIKRSRVAGLRVYLARPWYSSGDGERLGVVYRDSVNFLDLSDAQKAVVTQWGVDPIWLSQAPDEAATKDNFKEPKKGADQLSLEEIGDPVSVAGYLPQYDEERRLWFADVPMIVRGYSPFVRLALARYQPNSVDGAHLSRVVRADFAQLAPDRFASVTTTKTATNAEFSIGVTGLTYVGSSATIAADANKLFSNDDHKGLAEIEAQLQRRNPNLGSDPDLCWENVSTTWLTQVQPTFGEWQGTLTLNEPLVANTFRILLCEREWYRSDFEAEGAQENVEGEGRIVYADSIMVG